MFDIDHDVRAKVGALKFISFNLGIEYILCEEEVIDGIPMFIPKLSQLFPLMLFYRAMIGEKRSSKLKDLKGLSVRYRNFNCKDEAFIEILESNSPFVFKKLNKNLIDNGNVDFGCSLKSYLKVKDNIDVVNSSILKFKDLRRKFKRLFGAPPIFSERGELVAIIGTDGAGKSSLIKKLLSNDYLKNRGARCVYLGVNEASNPVLLKIYKFCIRKNYNIFKFIPMALIELNLRLRMIYAMYYRYQGCLVICDRYFFDKKAYWQSKKKTNKIKGFLISIYYLTYVDPDLTIYLDVDPEVAYNRKQDFILASSINVNRSYKDIVKKEGFAEIVNANNSEESVFDDSFELIVKTLGR